MCKNEEEQVYICLHCFIDFNKAFDWINREFLQYRLLNSGVNGKFYYAIKSLYQAPVARVQVNEYTTGWFSQQFGIICCHKLINTNIR